MAKKATSPRRVMCYHCRHLFEVSQRTMSVPCPQCHKVVMVEDVVVKNYRPVNTIQTCGRVIIHKGGRVAAKTIEAHQGVEVNGALDASVLSGGPVVVKAKAEWKGDLRAPSLEVQMGARFNGGYFVIPDDPLALGIEDDKKD